MAFDAGMLSFVTGEINDRAAGGKVEKIYQPARDEFIFVIRRAGETHRLLINAGSRCPRISLTGEKAENPAKAPMLCMMFRKYLQGATFEGGVQLGFERAVRLDFDAGDDLGYRCKKHIIVEMMGKYSNIILCDESLKIINLLRQSEMSQSGKRILLPGIIYEEPPKQDKTDPLFVDREQFNILCADADPDRLCEKFIMSTFSGISPLVAREIAFESGGAASATLSECAPRLGDVFFNLIRSIVNRDGTPSMVLDSDGAVREYCFIPPKQYGSGYTVRNFDTFGELLDTFFADKAREEKLSQRASDITHLVSAAHARALRKLDVRRRELEECDEGEKYKLWGDLITANIYRLRRGASDCVLQDYTTGEDVEIPLDTRLTPAQNAQRYYKKYAKAKSARAHLTEQIALSEQEIDYIASVQDALARAETEKELTEIRAELARAGYASGLKIPKSKENTRPSYLTFKTRNGYTVYCGKNNTANDWLTFKKADRRDWWFHAKGMAGSHVIMECASLEEPPAEDFTDACMIAAVYSKAAERPSAEIDYTLVKNVKKPPESKPGYVIYHTNWSANVPVDRAAVEAMRVK